MMPYKLKIRKTKPFELYNNLEVNDIAELGFFLNIGESPTKIGKKIVAEHLWVEIKQIVFESNDIYNAVLTEEPRFLKHLHKGATVSFSPENVLNAKSKKVQKKIKSIADFVYGGSDKSRQVYKDLIRDGNHVYAIDPQVLVIRNKSSVKEAIPQETLDTSTRQEFDDLLARFDKVELDKFHVTINREFIKKSAQKIRARAATQSSPVSPSPLIRISDRTYLSFNLVSKVLILLKKMLVYLEIHDDIPMLYFIGEKYDGFIALADQPPDAVIVDVLEK